MWDLPGLGNEPLSLVLAGGFLITGPPGRSHLPHFSSILLSHTPENLFFFWLYIVLVFPLEYKLYEGRDFYLSYTFTLA